MGTKSTLKMQCTSCLWLMAVWPLQRQRTVYRLTLVKAWNVEEMQAYSELIALGQPDFIEVKVGHSIIITASVLNVIFLSNYHNVIFLFMFLLFCVCVFVFPLCFCTKLWHVSRVNPPCSKACHICPTWLTFYKANEPIALATRLFLQLQFILCLLPYTPHLQFCKCTKLYKSSNVSK